MQRKFVLIGLPGVGKTTLTSRCIQILRQRGISCDLLSTDKIIRDRFKSSDPVIQEFEKLKNINIPRQVFDAVKPTGEFIKIFGEEPLFRDLEEAFVADIIQKSSSTSWLDLGGKAPLRANTIFNLAKKEVVPIFLYADESTIIDRLKQNDNWSKRSNYAMSGENGWQKLAHKHRVERLDKYINVARIIISVEMRDDDGEYQGQKSVEELAKEIFFRVKEFDSAKNERENSFVSRR